MWPPYGCAIKHAICQAASETAENCAVTRTRVVSMLSSHSVLCSFNMPPCNSSSAVSLALSTTHPRSTSPISVLFSSMPLQLEKTHPVSPQPLESDQSINIDDISDIEDSDSDNDLSPILGAVIVSSITVLCIRVIVYSNAFLTRLSQFPKTLPTPGVS
jgi:hypothetical protein